MTDILLVLGVSSIYLLLLYIVLTLGLNKEMNFISKFLQKRKERIDKENQEYWEAHKLSKSLAEKELHKLQDRMLRKLCAINKAPYCSKDCIHYYSGSILDFSSPDEMYPVHKVFPPSCKLWKS